MARPRIVIVTDRFWPLAGNPEMALAALAAGLVRQGINVDVLTVRWGPQWPVRISYRGANIRRELLPSGGFFVRRRRLANLVRWLRSNLSSGDVAYVTSMREEAAAAVRASANGKRFRVVLRPSCVGASGDLWWQLDAKGGRRIRQACLRAAAFIAPHPAAHKELIAAGFARESIHLVRDQLEVVRRTSPDAVRQARRDLGACHPALAAEKLDRVALSVGDLAPERGLGRLIDSWPAVLARHPTARLWLIGSGPSRRGLVAQVQELGLTGTIAIPGPFDRLDELFTAADIYVGPAMEEAPCLFLRAAMQARMPLAATDLEAHRESAGGSPNAYYAPLGDSRALAGTVADAFGRIGVFKDSADPRSVPVEYDSTSHVEEMVRGHLEVIGA